MPAHHRALIADDQPDVLAALRLLLKHDGYEIEAAVSPVDALGAAEAREFDVALVDLNYARDTTSGREGLELVERLHAVDQTLPIVVMTAWGTIELAVEAMRRGGSDFVLKPWENARLLATLRDHVARGAAARERRCAEAFEVEDARDVQSCLLPKRLPAVDGLEISETWRPAHALSGDYFDVIALDDRRLAVCIADASGKGTGAALVVSNIQAAVRAIAAPDLSPAALCERVNRIVWQNTAANRFVTFFYAVVDTRERTLAYANAGHNAPIRITRDGTISRFDAGGAVMGVFEEARYESAAVALESGDRVVLFTDGVVEARCENGEELGDERLVALARDARGETAEQMRHRLMCAVEEFCRNSFDDDATLVTLAIE
jgi:sigma-B regulation protein RsbU (phosphoserine phosphatase)